MTHLSSMTGFHAHTDQIDGWSWAWELKGVNGRGLEARMRLANGAEALEPFVRQQLKTKLYRGSIHVHLSITREQSSAQLAINPEGLEAATTLLKQVQSKIDCAPPRADRVLAMRGVLEDQDEGAPKDLPDEVLGTLKSSFDKALTGFVRARQSEGKAMDSLLREQLARIETLTKDARAQAAIEPKQIKKRLETQLKELLGDAMVNEERLAQEAAVLALKADIREELDRLDAHVAAGLAKLDDAGPHGRALDFLSQEFSREANTLCSKTGDLALKEIGLELKTVIDQLREQIQNVE